MRRAFAVLAVMSVVAACGGGVSSDTAPASSSTTSTTEASAWSVVAVDATAVTGQLPVVVVGPDGRVGVVYVRELGDDDQEMVWSSCVDADCTAMTHSTLARGHMVLSLAAGSTGSGVIIGGGSIDEEGQSVGTVWACDGWACGAPVETNVGERTGLAVLRATPEQQPVIAYSVWPDPEACAFELVVGLCEDPACAVHRSVPVYGDELGYGNLSLGRLPDDSPVVFFTMDGDPDHPGRWVVAVCDDPDCSTVLVEEQSFIPLGESLSYFGTSSWPVAGSELPSVVYTVGADLRRLECGDARCSTVDDRILYTFADAEVVGQVAAASSGETTNVLVQYAVEWPDEQGEGFFDWKLRMLTCDEEGCQVVEDAPFTEGNWFSIGQGAGGRVAVAVQTGRIFLCGDGCADPADHLSELTLYIWDVPTD